MGITKNIIGLWLSGFLFVAAEARSNGQAVGEPPQRTNAGWVNLCRSISADADRASAKKKVLEFGQCSSADLRKRLLRRLSEDPREGVAATACEALARTGAEEADAQIFWKVHDRCRGMVNKSYLVRCIGLTGDIDSVPRLCEIARSPWTPKVMDEGLFVWETYIVSAQTSLYLLTGHAESFVLLDRPRDPVRIKVCGDIAKKTAEMKKVATQERSRKLVEEFIAKGLTQPCRYVAQYGLLRFAGRFPIPPPYFRKENIEFTNEQWKRYRSAWEEWWVDHKATATFDKERGYFVTPTPSPPGIAHFLIGA